MLETINLADALELIRLNEAGIVTQFQTWLTITFATIVAVFAGKSLLSFVIKWLITGLYVGASITITGMCIYLAESNAQISRLLISRNVELASPLFVGAALFLLIIVGSLTTCYFIHMHSNTEATER